MTKAEYLLTCLIEECAEVQQDVTKSIRFGLADRYPADAPTNQEKLMVEILHVLAVVELLEQDEVLDAVDADLYNKILEDKKKKTKRWMRYSRECGTLEEERRNV